MDGLWKGKAWVSQPGALREISIISEACTRVQYIHHEPVLPQVLSPRGPWRAWKLWLHTPLKRTKCPWAVESTECPKEKTVVGEMRSPMASKSTGMAALGIVSSHWHTRSAFSASSSGLAVCVAWCATSEAELTGVLSLCLLWVMPAVGVGPEHRLGFLLQLVSRGMSRSFGCSNALRSTHWNWCSVPFSSFMTLPPSAILVPSHLIFLLVLRGNSNGASLLSQSSYI